MTRENRRDKVESYSCWPRLKTLRKRGKIKRQRDATIQIENYRARLDKVDADRQSHAQTGLDHHAVRNGEVAAVGDGPLLDDFSPGRPEAIPTRITVRIDKAMLAKAVAMFEDFLQYSNHVNLYTEEISTSGEGLGNAVQGFT